MSRVALLPTPCDPFVTLVWLECFKKYWQDEVDRLHVHINSSLEYGVVEYVKEKLAENSKITVTYENHMADHGPSLTKMLLGAKEDLVMFAEDDCLIFKSGIVDDCFRKIEDGHFDIVGSGRGSCSQNIWEASGKKYGLDYHGFGDKGPNFWPNCFFAKRSDLMKTDLNFAARTWQPGERIEELDLDITETTVGDTFVWGSIQLMNMGLRVCYVPQFHGHPEDLNWYEKKQGLWNGDAYWIHIGSVSSGMNGIIRSSNGKPMALKKDDSVQPSELPVYVTTEAERGEFERRVGFWMYCLEEVSVKHPALNKFDNFCIDYAGGIVQIIKTYKLDLDKITKYMKIYKELINL